MAIAILDPTKVVLHRTYVAPASLLSDESVDEHDPSSLRADASCNGVCYLSLSKSLPDGGYVAKVAVHPEQVMQGFTLVVSAEHIAHLQPFQA